MAIKELIEKRRLQIARLIACGIRPAEIRRELGLAENTLVRDLRAIREEMKQRFTPNIAEVTFTEYMQVNDELRREMWKIMKDDKNEDNKVKITTARAIIEIERDRRETLQVYGILPNASPLITMQKNVQIQNNMQINAQQVIETYKDVMSAWKQYMESKQENAGLQTQ